MKHVHYLTQGVCSREIDFDLAEDGTLHGVRFTGGCSGNLLAIAKLSEGKDARGIASLLAGNRCGGKPTSCADQLSQAIFKNL